MVSRSMNNLRTVKFWKAMLIKVENKTPLELIRMMHNLIEERRGYKYNHVFVSNEIAIRHISGEEIEGFYI